MMLVVRKIDHTCWYVTIIKIILLLIFIIIITTIDIDNDSSYSSCCYNITLITATDNNVIVTTRTPIATRTVSNKTSFPNERISNHPIATTIGIQNNNNRFGTIVNRWLLFTTKNMRPKASNAILPIIASSKKTDSKLQQQQQNGNQQKQKRRNNVDNNDAKILSSKKASPTSTTTTNINTKPKFLLLQSLQLPPKTIPTTKSTGTTVIPIDKSLISQQQYQQHQQQQQQQQELIHHRHIQDTTLTNKRTHRRHHPMGTTMIVVLHRSIVVLFVAMIKTTVKTVQTISKDWYMGYYLRTTFEHMDYQYSKRYDIPSCIRSIVRILLHGTIVFSLGHVMEWMVGLTQHPCQYNNHNHISLLSSSYNGVGGGCHWWCALLWLVAVIGPGHAIGVAIAIWVKGLQLQFPITTTTIVDYSNNSYHHNTIGGGTSIQYKRPSILHILSRPMRIVRYILDPDQWFREVLTTRNKAYYYTTSSTTNSNFFTFLFNITNPIQQSQSQSQQQPQSQQHVLKPFDPDYQLFPTTWRIVRIIQIIAIAKEMYGTNQIMHTFMKYILYQQIFGDEWYRIVICEKRYIWGMIIMIGYIASTLMLLYHILYKPSYIVSSISILMFIPSVIAVIVSFYMNIIIYYERRQKNISIVNILSTKPK
jgi:hypothetical protein